MAKGKSIYVKGCDVALTAEFLRQAGKMMIALSKAKDSWKVPLFDDEGKEIVLGAHLLVGGFTLEHMAEELEK